MRTETHRTDASTEVTPVTATRAVFFDRVRSMALALKDKAGAVSEGRWNTLIIAAFLLVVGSMVCSKVIDEEAQASTKLQPLASSVKSKWRGGMRAVQADDVVKMEVVESASPSWNGASVRSMDGWVVDEEGVGARGAEGVREMRAM